MTESSTYGRAAETPTENGSIWDLVEEAKAGDMAAMEALYRLHADAVFTYIYSRTGERHRAEDLTSDVFIRMLRRIDSLTHRRSTFRAWLITIARNAVMDDQRSANRRYESPVLESVEPPDGSADPAEVVCERELAGSVRRSLTHLTGDQQRCVELRFLRGLSVTEVAERMNRDPRSISALQLRALRKLERLVAREGVTGSRVRQRQQPCTDDRRSGRRGKGYVHAPR
ncbi:sigma-70 family RNA polymerase sigma factor [Haloechinothrix sp. YIM 98757]|uniref:Sigma-70 family RNA polymerase sigma factor n=1 Tax=Haloechinothrix aidingensis TaxID=2752311 RepID=A0A838AC33_9PSEU|nr:sigma-70 family RNA polymerase sigma factor [Haloechinothrix aidingensis]MBA0126822.1 sigma-70 family RNA polymerase sigma factor [Haloechinothrix aidingensis]